MDMRNNTLCHWLSLGQFYILLYVSYQKQKWQHLEVCFSMSNVRFQQFRNIPGVY